MPVPAGDWGKTFDPNPAFGTPSEQGWTSTYGDPIFNVGSNRWEWLGDPYSIVYAPNTNGYNPLTNPFIASFQLAGNVGPGTLESDVATFKHRLSGTQSTVVFFAADNNVYLSSPGTDVLLGTFGGSDIVILSLFHDVDGDLHNRIQMGSSYGTLATVYDGEFRNGVGTDPGMYMGAGRPNVISGVDQGDTFGKILWLVSGEATPPSPPAPSTAAGSCNLFIPFKDWADNPQTGLAGIQQHQSSTPGNDFENFKVFERWANLVGPRVCACPECNP